MHVAPSGFSVNNAATVPPSPRPTHTERPSDPLPPRRHGNIDRTTRCIRYAAIAHRATATRDGACRHVPTIRCCDLAAAFGPRSIAFGDRARERSRPIRVTIAGAWRAPLARTRGAPYGPKGPQSRRCATIDANPTARCAPRRNLDALRGRNRETEYDLDPQFSTAHWSAERVGLLGCATRQSQILSTMPDSTIYTSSGTVALSSRAGNNHLRFTPATHHSTEHGGTTYAVFLPDPPSGSDPIPAKLAELKDKYVRVEVDDAGLRFFDMLGRAASGAFGVDIDVHVDGDKLVLRGATVPAKSHTK